MKMSNFFKENINKISYFKAKSIILNFVAEKNNNTLIGHGYKNLVGLTFS